MCTFVAESEWESFCTQNLIVQIVFIDNSHHFQDDVYFIINKGFYWRTHASIHSSIYLHSLDNLTPEMLALQHLQPAAAATAEVP